MDTAKELAELFVAELKASANAKDSILRRAETAFTEMLAEGWTPGKIKAGIYRYKKLHPTEEERKSLMFVKQIFDGLPIPQVDTGLMQEGVFYFHPRLQSAPKAPVMTVTDDGDFVEVDGEEFFLEMRESFTMAELVDYFYNKTATDNRNYRRDSRAFEYIFNQIILEEPYSALDLMLFTIDAAIVLAYDLDRPMPRSIDIEDYLKDGLALYMEKYNYCKLAGLDHVTSRGQSLVH